jgi:regulator of cell morphogenesis and NO signaling
MTIASLAATLRRQHREIDTGIEEFLRAGDVWALTRAVRALRRHIYLEEEFLFPPLAGAGLVAPIFVMLREHGQIWVTLDTLDAALAGDADPEVLDAACRRLTVLEQHHNPKEERILYPQADHALPAPAAARLQAFLASGELPDGWVCERARVPSR